MDNIKKIILDVEKLKSEGFYDDAERMIEKAIMAYSNDYRLYEEIADINLYKGDLNKAKKAVNYALELNSLSATGNYLKGFLLLSNDRIEEAVLFLEKSNKYLGNNSEVLRNLGWAYTMLGDTARGISVLKRALTIAPGDKLITEDLAMALIGAGEIEKGNTILKKVKNKI